MTEKKHTFCRVCEPSCALVAEVENNRLIKLTPDKAHPVSRGFACHKGINFQAIHEDPDRLNTPLKRVNPKTEPGAFEEQSWDQSFVNIASQIKSIQERFGTDAIAAYVGNPTAFNALGSQAMMSFFTQLGVRRLFNSGTQDCSNKFAGAEAVFGTSTLHPIPDLARTRYALIFGENPKVSHM